MKHYEGSKKHGIKFWKISTFVLFALLLIIFVWFITFAYHNGQINVVETQKKVNQLAVIGVLRTSGLSGEEKYNLGLKTSSFQLELFNVDYSKENAIQGYYLESATIDMENSLGRCVRIEGKIEEPLGFVTADAYRRSVLKIYTLTPLDFTKCTPYSSTLERTKVIGTQMISLHGVVERMDRILSRYFL